jgi:hypothetical protein
MITSTGPEQPKIIVFECAKCPVVMRGQEDMVLRESVKHLREVHEATL